MTREASLIAENLSTDRSVSRSALSDRTVSEFFGWLATAIRDRFRDKKIALELADYLGCDERSASRYLAGDRFPSGPQFLRFFEDDVLAPQIVTALLNRLPEDRRARMAAALMDAADLVKTGIELEQMAREFAAKKSRMGSTA